MEIKITFFKYYILILFLVVSVMCQNNKTFHPITKSSGNYNAEMKIVNFNNCKNKDFVTNKNLFYKNIYANIDRRTFRRYDCSSCTSFKWDGIGNSIVMTWKKGNSYVSDTSSLSDNWREHDMRYSNWLAADTGFDIRNIEPSHILEITIWGGIGQLYIPVLHAQDSGLVDRKMFMVQIAPDDNVYNNGNRMCNLGGSKVFGGNNGKGLATPDSQCFNNPSPRNLYKTFHINFTHIFSHMDNYMSNDVKNAFKEGQISTRERLPLRRWTNLDYSDSLSTENLCNFEPVSPPAWKEVLSKLVDVFMFGKEIWGILT